MEKEYSYRNLIMWQRAQALAFSVIKLTERLPHNWSNAIIARQIIAAATSIGANIAEGHGRFTPGAHGNHLSIAKGSAAETDSWLDLLRRGSHITEQEETVLHRECLEISKMLLHKIRELERLRQAGSESLREWAEPYDAVMTFDEPPVPFTDSDYVKT